MLIPRSLLILVLAASFMAVFSGAGADESAGGVSLILSKASAEHGEQYILFRCEARLDNDTGKELTARSNFPGVLFDGLQLVVTDKAGKLLAQQAYDAHQAPFAPPGKSATLKKGSTTAK